MELFGFAPGVRVKVRVRRCLELDGMGRPVEDGGFPTEMPEEVVVGTVNRVSDKMVYVDVAGGDVRVVHFDQAEVI